MSALASCMKLLLRGPCACMHDYTQLVSDFRLVSLLAERRHSSLPLRIACHKIGSLTSPPRISQSCRSYIEVDVVGADRVDQ